MIGVLLLACAAPDPATGDDSAAEPDLPHLESPTAQATWSRTEAVSELNAAFALGLPDPLVFRDHYMDLMRQGDPHCPGHPTHITDDWVLGCTALSGVWFSGITEYYEDLTGDDPWWILLGDAQLTDAEGYEYSLGGHVLESNYIDDNSAASVYTAQIHGAMLYEAAAPPFDQRVSAFFQLSVEDHLDDSEVVSVEGGVTAHARSLNFVGFSVVRDAACDWSPKGVVAIRDPSGAWFTLEMEEACGACGALTFADDQDLGRVCVALGPLLDRAHAQATR